MLSPTEFLLITQTSETVRSQIERLILDGLLVLILLTGATVIAVEALSHMRRSLLRLRPRKRPKRQHCIKMPPTDTTQVDCLVPKP